MVGGRERASPRWRARERRRMGAGCRREENAGRHGTVSRGKLKGRYRRVGGQAAGIDPVTQPKENACEVQKADTAKWSPAPALRLGRAATLTNLLAPLQPPPARALLQNLALILGILAAFPRRLVLLFFVRLGCRRARHYGDDDGNRRGLFVPVDRTGSAEGRTTASRANSIYQSDISGRGRSVGEGVDGLGPVARRTSGRAGTGTCTPHCRSLDTCSTRSGRPSVTA